jgi:methionyl-tRNA formyltransferase
MNENLVFFGSGPVAAEALALLAKDFSVEAVITKPQPAHHKEAFPVLELAKKLGLRVLTPANKRELSDLFAQKPVKSRIGVVIDYGIIIGQDVIDYFPLGIVNSHFSLLPRWRGADPISFAVLEGDDQTGVSLMLIVEQLDEGPLLAQKPIKITPDTTTPSLTKQLIDLSHQLLLENLPLYAKGELKPYPQPHHDPTYSRKLSKTDGQIDWNKPAERIEREIRAFMDWPKSRARLGSTEVIITRAHAVPSNDQRLKPGDITTMPEEGVIMVECGRGHLCIDSLKPVGKKEMSAKAFLAGYSLN